MDENIRKPMYVVDASFVLAFLYPSERNDYIFSIFNKHINKEAILISTTLLPFEVINSLRTYVLRKRFTKVIATKMYMIFKKMDIMLIKSQYDEILEEAIGLNLSCYDASYLVLAKQEKAHLLTFDDRLKKLSDS